MKDFPKARFGDTYASNVYVSKGYSALPPVERLAIFLAAGLLRPHRIALH
jgi:hypothetical protein